MLFFGIAITLVVKVGRAFFGNLLDDVNACIDGIAP